MGLVGRVMAFNFRIVKPSGRLQLICALNACTCCLLACRLTVIDYKFRSFCTTPMCLFHLYLNEVNNYLPITNIGLTGVVII